MCARQKPRTSPVQLDLVRLLTFLGTTGLSDAACVFNCYLRDWRLEMFKRAGVSHLVCGPPLQWIRLPAGQSLDAVSLRCGTGQRLSEGHSVETANQGA